jgi:copper transport outer membrane protein MctB
VFDLRYHVASLAAVFLALILGIVIGAAISDPTLADATENDRLRQELGLSESRRETAEQQARSGEAAQTFAGDAYDVLMKDRLAGRRVVLVSVGAFDERLDEAAEAVRDAGGTVIRRRALQLPSDPDAIEAALDGNADLERYRGDGHLSEVGRQFAHDLVNGGQDTPVLDALDDVLVQQRRGRDSDAPADAVVVARPAGPQRGPLARLVNGLYQGFATAGPPAVGVDLASADGSAVRAFARADLPTVSNVETVPGKVALAVVLAGGQGGHYGFGKGEDVAPEIDAVPADTRSG